MTKASEKLVMSSTVLGKSAESWMKAPSERIFSMAVSTASIISWLPTYVTSKKHFRGTPSRRP